MKRFVWFVPDYSNQARVMRLGGPRHAVVSPNGYGWSVMVDGVKTKYGWTEQINGVFPTRREAMGRVEHLLDALGWWPVAARR